MRRVVHRVAQHDTLWHAGGATRVNDGVEVGGCHKRELQLGPHARGHNRRERVHRHAAGGRGTQRPVAVVVHAHDGAQVGALAQERAQLQPLVLGAHDQRQTRLVQDVGVSFRHRPFLVTPSLNRGKTIAFGKVVYLGERRKKEGAATATAAAAPQQAPAEP